MPRLNFFLLQSIKCHQLTFLYYSRCVLLILQPIYDLIHGESVNTPHHDVRHTLVHEPADGAPANA
jgi:hypothetical protein